MCVWLWRVSSCGFDLTCTVGILLPFVFFRLICSNKKTKLCKRIIIWAKLQCSGSSFFTAGLPVKHKGEQEKERHLTNTIQFYKAQRMEKGLQEAPGDIGTDKK